MKKILKNKKFLLGFILGAFIFGTTGVLAVTYYASKDVTYDNTESGMTSENVQDAIDELYGLATAFDVGGSKIPTVTSGDGLYVDGYEDNVYTYRGSNRVNTSDNTIKIMRNRVLSDRHFDTISGRYQGSSRYCNYSGNGCNIWGSSSTLYDTNLSPITTLGREVNGTKYTLPTTEAPINTYLNGEYYNGLNETARSMVKQYAIYKAGVLKWQSGQTISTDVSQVKAAKWKGKVALIDATEYVRASTNSSCTSVDVAYDTTNCKNNNWMFNSDIWWTLSPYSSSYSRSVWYVNSSGDFSTNFAIRSNGVRPVVTLSSEVQITSGDGSESSPYQLSL